MQSYNVIVGVVDMKLKGFSYEDIRMRHKVGSSTITLIMNRFYDVEKSIDELKSLPPRDVEEFFTHQLAAEGAKFLYLIGCKFTPACFIWVSMPTITTGP